VTKILQVIQDRQCTYNVRLRSVRVTIVAVRSSNIIYSVCVCVCVFVALVIQHAKRMRRTISSCLACLAYLISPHYIINDTIVGKRLFNKKCTFRFSLQFFSETFLILRRIQGDITYVHNYFCQIFNESRIFSTHF
jgi:hypothetical protein